jgi:hypothetical protein
MKMAQEGEPNLDRLCFKYGIEIPVPKNEKNENIIQKSLGVLQEDGVFAFILYVEAKGAFNTKGPKEEEKIAGSIKLQVCNLLKEEGISLFGDTIDPDNQRSVIEAFKSLGEGLDSLLLAKALIEKTLIYALYHSKSM